MLPDGVAQKLIGGLIIIKFKILIMSKFARNLYLTGISNSEEQKNVKCKQYHNILGQ
jgi:hypothetical protein